METGKLKRIYKAIMLIILTAVITFIITSVCMYNQYKNDKTAKYVVTDNISLTFQTFKKYISDKYLYDIDESKMLESAIKGYVAGLDDPFSEYITKDEMKEYIEDAVGNYIGIGVYIAKNSKTNEIVVLTPIKGSPAEAAGIKTGDVIKKVDGVEYSGDKLLQASAALKKDEGTKAIVEIAREGDTITLEIERKRIKINHIESDVIEEKIGYINISTFDEGCYDEFLSKWNELKEKGVTSLIIDLRNNGGGIVKEALDIADLMVDKDKTLLMIKSKNEEIDLKKSTKDKEIDIPVVVLINEGTASSSEMLAAAIKENNDKVTLIGKRSYGKGVIQTIYTLSDGSGLKLTTNEYYTPNHNAINNIGITPDVEVSLPEGTSLYSIEKDNDTQLKKAIEVLKK